ncbi:hypothetical protein [Zhihengliuella flava]|uniref:Uncharacterized protein n=1 Tax=Zhihengliuella flava TaxID=1285193 RepID=A0A931D9S5_9MICC|nr:hypothetical protein [Zhihengliuella flava]MBG6084969.1 hypothetical protein [Zhihengliuella flava]
MDTAGQNDAGAGALGRPANDSPVTEPTPAERGRFVERILWTFAAGAAVYALVFALISGGLGHLVVGRPPALIVTLLIGAFPLVMMLAGYLAARPVEAYRGVALIGILLGAALTIFGFSHGAVHAVTGIGLLLWAFKTREQILVWAGVASLVLTAAHLFVGGLMVPASYAETRPDAFGPAFTVAPYWVGVLCALMLAACAIAQWFRRRRAAA